jgi:hypothetical protein
MQNSLVICIFVIPLNYLSHFYFDRLHGNEIHNFGLAMPDFVRNFIKGRKLKPLDTPSDKSEDWQNLHKGVLKHIQRDHTFHNSGYFHEIGKGLNELIQPAFTKASIPRYWFASHLLSEMVIDRILIKKYPTLAPDFYHEIAIADRGVIEKYLLDHQIVETDVFLSRLHRFCEAQYLNQYVHDHALAYSINRIYMYTGADKEWTTKQFDIVINILPEIESRVETSFLKLIEEMK